MDHTDYQILNILQRDARTTLKEIGNMVGLTSPAVAERIRKLEDSGVIQNFSVKIDRSRINGRIAGFSLVALDPKVYDAFCLFCRTEPAVICHYHLVGVFNAMIRFAVPDTKSLDSLLQKIKLFGNSRTSIELCTYFDSKDVAPLPSAPRGSGQANRPSGMLEGAGHPVEAAQ